MFQLFNRQRAGYEPVQCQDAESPVAQVGSGPVAHLASPAGAPAQGHPELQSSVGFYRRILDIVRPLREWAPSEGELKQLQELALTAQAHALKGLPPTPQWRDVAVHLQARLQPYLQAWQDLTGLSQHRMNDYAWIQEAPMEAGFDQVVQRQLIMADTHFHHARREFLAGGFNAAGAHHERALYFCGLADALIECHRSGSERFIKVAQELFEIGLVSGRFEGFRGFLQDAHWRRDDAPDALVTAQGGRPAPVTPAVVTPGDVDTRLKELRHWLRPSYQQQELLQREDPRAHPVLSKPDQRMKDVLDLLTQEQPSRDQPVPPDYLLLLTQLENDVERVASIERWRRDAQLAQGALADMFDIHPSLTQQLEQEWRRSRRLHAQSLAATEQGRSDLAYSPARESFDVATAGLEKARQAQDGRWPTLKAQSERCATLCAEAKAIKKEIESGIAEWYLKRFWIHLRQYTTALQPAQADKALDLMQVTLGHARAHCRLPQAAKAAAPTSTTA